MLKNIAIKQYEFWAELYMHDLIMMGEYGFNSYHFNSMKNAKCSMNRWKKFIK